MSDSNIISLNLVNFITIGIIAMLFAWVYGAGMAKLSERLQTS